MWEVKSVMRCKSDWGRVVGHKVSPLLYPISPLFPLIVAGRSPIRWPQRKGISASHLYRSQRHLFLSMQLLPGTLPANNTGQDRCEITYIYSGNNRLVLFFLFVSLLSSPCYKTIYRIPRAWQARTYDSNSPISVSRLPKTRPILSDHAAISLIYPAASSKSALLSYLHPASIVTPVHSPQSIVRSSNHPK